MPCNSSGDVVPAAVGNSSSNNNNNGTVAEEDGPNPVLTHCTLVHAETQTDRPH